MKIFKLNEILFVGQMRYVSLRGNDTRNNCTRVEIPCRSLAHAVSVSTNSETVAVIGGQNDTKITKEKDHLSDTLLGEKLPIIITKSLNFLCILGRCQLHMPKDSFAFIAGHILKQINLSFVDFELIEANHGEKTNKNCKPSSHGFIVLQGCSLTLDRCILRKMCTAVFMVGRKDDFSKIKIEQSIVEDVHYTIYSKNVSLIKLEMNNTRITGGNDSPVPYYAVSLIIQDVAFIHFLNCTFKNLNEAIAISTYHNKLLLKVERCHFLENSGQSILISFPPLLGLEMSRIQLEKLSFTNNDAGFASSVHLIRAINGGNDYAKHTGPTISLEDSIFKNNYAQAFFGAIYADGVNLDISNTVFYNNSAGNDESSIQAFGGAIFVESKAFVTAINTSFLENTCSGFGGSVFSRGTFKAINCLFRGPLGSSVSPLLGDILYATAGLHLENTTWYPGKVYRSKAIWHPGSPTLEQWDIKIQGYFFIYCPVGHNITGHGLIRKHGMSTDRMSLSCRSCPRSHYSLQSGHLKVISHENKIIYRDEKEVFCLLCRYGGVCDQGKIKARSNYYGYINGDSKEVKFISCPFGYCCQGVQCRSYNSCSLSRQSTLCGSCIDGTTENLLNSKCVKFENCKDRWFWSIYFPFGIIYVIFFMYIDKVSKFLKGQFVLWESALHTDGTENKSNEARNRLKEKLDGSEEENSVKSIEIQKRNTEYNNDDNRNESSCGTEQKEEIAVTPFDEEIAGSDSEPTEIAQKVAENIEHESLSEQPEKKSDGFSDVINIAFYFYQIIFIIRDHDNALLTKTFAFIKDVSNSFFTFSIGSRSSLSLCPFVGLTPITKSVLVHSIAIYVIAMLFIMNIVNALCIVAHNRFKNSMAIEVTEMASSFSVRLRVTTIQILLLAYSTVTKVIINFVNCVPINGHYVLYMDGTIRCFNWLQVLAFMFIVFWIVPFPFALVFGIHRMRCRETSYNGFILGLTCPIHYVICSAVGIYLLPPETNACKDDIVSRKVDFRAASFKDDIEQVSVKEILRRFEAPFKDREQPCSLVEQPGVWQGVMIMRRLIIILLFTFTNSPVTRLYCIFIACLLFLMHHLINLPYKNKIVNLVETCSSATLVIFCSINLFFAYSYVSNVLPEHADSRISAIFNWLEVFILVFFPILFTLLLVSFVFTKFFISVYRWLHSASSK